LVRKLIICWSLAKESVPAHLAGTISGFIKHGHLLGATVLQATVAECFDRAGEARSWKGSHLQPGRLSSGIWR